MIMTAVIAILAMALLGLAQRTDGTGSIAFDLLFIVRSIETLKIAVALKTKMV